MEMFRKKYFVIAASVIYLFLIMLFFVFKETTNFSKVCYGDDICLRFCCKTKETCNDKFIKQHFKGNITRFPYSESENQSTLITDYKIMYGQPNCNQKLVEEHENWLFVYNGEVKMDNRRYTDKYCLQESSADEPVTWDLFVCESKLVVSRTLNYIFVSLSALLLATAVFVYFYLNELRSTNHGACVKYLLIGIFLMYISLPLLQLHGFFMVHAIAAGGICIGLTFSFLWMSCLVFDLWRTIKNVQQTSDGSERFKFYGWYAFGICGFIIFIFIVGAFGTIHPWEEILAFFFLGLFLLTLIADIVLLILSAVHLFQMAKNLNITDHKWFEEQKKRFFMYLQLYGIMFVTWSMEFYSWSFYRSIESKATVQILKLYSAVLIFSIFVLSQDVRSLIFKRYDTLRHQ